MTTPKPGADSRTRDELANERTFLAWLRTAANVMIVGLAIAKFGTGNEVTVWSLARRRDPGGRRSGWSGVRRRALPPDQSRSRRRRRLADRPYEGPGDGCVVLVVAIVISLALLLAGE